MRTEKDEAIRLRLKERLSYSEITARIGVKQGTLSGWLKDYPLTHEEKMKRHKPYAAPKKFRGDISHLASLVNSKDFSKKQKGEVAEAAVLLRVLAFGMKAFRPLGNGEREDLIVSVEGSNKLARLQIKWAGRDPEKEGLPSISMRYNLNNTKKPKTYGENDFDFIVGYNFYSDRAYVFSYSEVKHLTTCVTISEESEEKWGKILDYLKLK